MEELLNDEIGQIGFDDRMLTVKDVARILKVHPNSVRRWANQGLLVAYRVGTRGDRRFKPDDIDKFLRSWKPTSHPAS